MFLRIGCIVLEKYFMGKIRAMVRHSYKKEVERLIADQNKPPMPNCHFDGKPCTGEIIFDGPVCDGVWYGDSDGNEKQVVKSCPRFPHVWKERDKV